MNIFWTWTIKKIIFWNLNKFKTEHFRILNKFWTRTFFKFKLIFKSKYYWNLNKFSNMNIFEIWTFFDLNSFQICIFSKFEQFPNLKFFKIRKFQKLNMLKYWKPTNYRKRNHKSEKGKNHTKKSYWKTKLIKEKQLNGLKVNFVLEVWALSRFGMWNWLVQITIFLELRFDLVGYNW
jgi:hypothetical protein